jgi:hypothetical protein
MGTLVDDQLGRAGQAGQDQGSLQVNTSVKERRPHEADQLGRAGQAGQGQGSLQVITTVKECSAGHSISCR